MSDQAQVLRGVTRSRTKRPVPYAALYCATQHNSDEPLSATPMKVFRPHSTQQKRKFFRHKLSSLKEPSESVIFMMRAVVLTSFVGASTAFLGARPSRMTNRMICKAEEQTVTDLNLEEMFETFEAADAEVSSKMYLGLDRRYHTVVFKRPVRQNPCVPSNEI